MTGTKANTITRRKMVAQYGRGLALVAAGLALPARSDAAAPDDVSAAYNQLLDGYVAAVNAHDLGTFPEIFTESYIQHSGRSPSGLRAQITNYQRIFENWPDFQTRIEDRIFAPGKIVARATLSATHTRTVRGFAPTGRRVGWATIDIWRVENGKLAEHWDVVDIAGLLKQLRGD
jgi:predicted ester cyclase